MIRKYRKKDDDAIVDSWYQASLLAHPFLSAEFLKKEEQNIRNVYLPNTETWVYEIDEKVVGFISMIGNEVGAIFLNPKFHGQGIGKQLMDTVTEIHPVLEVQVFEKNLIGRGFYKRYGFVFMGQSVHDGTKEILFRLKYER